MMTGLELDLGGVVECVLHLAGRLLHFDDEKILGIGEAAVNDDVGIGRNGQQVILSDRH